MPMYQKADNLGKQVGPIDEYHVHYDLNPIKLRVKKKQGWIRRWWNAARSLLRWKNDGDLV